MNELEKFRTGGRAKSLDAHVDSITDIFNAERAHPGMYFGVLIGITVTHLSVVSSGPKHKSLNCVCCSWSSQARGELQFSFISASAACGVHQTHTQ